MNVEIFCLKYLKDFRPEFLQIKLCFLKYNKKENVILINRELLMPAQLDLCFRFSDLQPQSIFFQHKNVTCICPSNFIISEWYPCTLMYLNVSTMPITDVIPTLEN